jgi:quercetin dioxygenase-like cupin family protein
MNIELRYTVDPSVPPSEVAIPTVDEMYELEEQLLGLPQIDFQLVNRFADGLYARQVTMCAGARVTSRIHLKEHFAFVLTGDVSIWTDQDYQRVKAPAVLVTRPGTKRVLLIHEESTWVTVHATNAKTQEEAENELTTNDPDVIQRVRQP